MVGKTDYSSVPTTVDLENNSNQKKYTVNRKPGGLVISKPLCTLMAIGALLLAVLVGLIVFFLVPRCSGSSSSSSSHPVVTASMGGGTKNGNILEDQMVDGSLEESNRLEGSAAGLRSYDVDERLPRNVEPLQYSIQILPNFDTLTTNGVTTITLKATEDTDQIVFHLKEIEIIPQSLRIDQVGSDIVIGVAGHDYIEGERYRLILNQTLVKDKTYALRIQFMGHLNGHLQGFYISQYQDGNKVTRLLASTQFSPTDARRAFPCFDEPIFKANFSIVVGRPSNMSTISNMPIVKSYENKDLQGWFWDEYPPTPKMSTYLVAFIVSDLQPYGTSDKLIKIWSRKELISETRYAAEIAPRILRFFEDYFTIKFPLPKIDIVAVPDFGFSAMENWGLITFRESSLLFEDQQSDMDDKRSVATVLTHELGHQWFGNLVTPKWWKDLWLKEGFATYLQYLGVGYAEPSWKIDEEFIVSETNRAFALDSLESSRAISFDVKNNKQIRQTFDELSYGKGACIIRMMNHFLGEDTFKAGLINYLNEFKYGNADRDDLFAALTKEAHKSGALDQSITVKEIMDSWTEQPGFPVVTAIWDSANKKLILSQKRFLYTQSDTQNSTWWVPISMTTDTEQDYGDTKPKIWLRNGDMMSIHANISQWYLLNINATGYYIVNYDQNNWRILTSNIINLPPLIRAQLISDSMDLARANLIDYDIPLKMIARMAVHDRMIMFVPTLMAFKKLEFLADILSSTPAFGLFEEYHSVIFRMTYRQVEGDMDYYSTDYLKQKIRRAVLKWACRKSGSECAIRAHHMYRTWMERRQSVPPNLRDLVYCTSIREGGEAEWDFAYREYEQTTSVSEKNILLDALGCTSRRWLLSRYLNMLVQNDSSIRIQDAARVFESVADNSVASSLAFDFLRMNWHKLLDHYGEGFNIISKMVKSLPRYMNTEYQLRELVRFRNEVKNNIGTAGQAFDSAIEKVRGNVEWMKKNYHNVERWFEDHKAHYNML